MSTDFGKLLIAKAKAMKVDVVMLANSYITEAVLRRVEASVFSSNAVLRGGKLWIVDETEVALDRPTTDTDFVAPPERAPTDLAETFKSLLGADMQDGVTFDNFKLAFATDQKSFRLVTSAKIGSLPPFDHQIDVGAGRYPNGVRMVRYSGLFPEVNPKVSMLSQRWEAAFAEKLVILHTMPSPSLACKAIFDMATMVRSFDLDPALIADIVPLAFKEHEPRASLPTRSSDVEFLGTSLDELRREWKMMAKKMSRDLGLLDDAAAAVATFLDERVFAPGPVMKV